MNKDNSADFLALAAILIAVISGCFNFQLIGEKHRLETENAKLLTEYRGFKDGCAYSR